MDVFKLLSKSSKASQTTPTQKLPSSGAVANPQLFGHDKSELPQNTSKKSRKRKRGQDAADAVTALPTGIDFFGGASGGSKSKRKQDTFQNNELRDGKTKELYNGVLVEEGIEEVAGGVDVEKYNEDECKRVLRSHKLKIVVLEDFASQEQDARKEKKRSKKRKRDKKEVPNKAKKKDKKQLFPQSLTSFVQLRTRYGISRRLAQNLDEQGYSLPTEVQLGALPLLLGSKNDNGLGKAGIKKGGVDASGAELGGNIDLLTIAPTGSGKTIAFLIPIINALLLEGKNAPTDNAGPRAVVVAPTKELASQIANEARKLGKGTGVKATLVKKGVEVVERPEGERAVDGSDSAEEDDDEDSASDAENTKKLTRPSKRKRRRAEVVKAAILVATPLALVNALKQGDEILELPNVRHLVLDEADVLLDPLFREQTLSIWNACINPHLRIGLWSATMGSNIEALTISTLNSRWTSLSSTSHLPPRAPLIRLVVGLKDTAIPNITHRLIYAATEQGKLLGLRQLLHPNTLPSDNSAPSLQPPFLIFTQTIPRAIALHSELLYDIPPEAGGSSRIAVLHADLSSSARSAIMTRFRKGEIWILITTDLLARGVDFRGLNGVVNYDVPNSAAAYVHRVGRTGRAGREGGVAVTFYTQEDIPYVKNVANVIRASEKVRGLGEGEEGSVKQWLLDALPTPSKRDKQVLKRRGVEARRSVKDEEGKGRARISTKSGYVRRVENNLRGARRANRRREEPKRIISKAGDSEGGSEFEGFE